MDFSLLPASLKVDLKEVAEEKNWYAKLLWEAIGPGWTAIFIFLTGIWYYYRASKQTDDAAKKELNDVGFSITMWGVINITAYLLLVYYQRGQRAKRVAVKMMEPTKASL